MRPGRERTVEDVKPVKFRNSLKNAPAFEAAREAFPPVGLAFNLWSPPSAVLCYNVRHLAGYRRTPVYMPTLSREILARTADGPVPLAELAEATGHHMLTRPVIFHLLWTHRLHTDLEQPLSHDSLIYRSEPGRAL